MPSRGEQFQNVPLRPGFGQFDQAIADYNEANRLNGEDLVALRGRGFAWFGKADYDDYGTVPCIVLPIIRRFAWFNPSTEIQPR